MNQIPSFTGAVPAHQTLPVAGLRFSLDAATGRERRPQVCEFLGLELTRSDVAAEPDRPLHVAGTLKLLPGLIMMSGRGHGYSALRSRETIAAEASDDVGLAVNVGDPLRLTRGEKELVLGNGEAVLVSLAETYCFTRARMGDLLALRIPRREIAPLVSGVDDLCNRRIGGGVAALKFLLDYVSVAAAEQEMACPQLQQLFVKHVLDLTALAVGATRDAGEMAQGRGLRAARLHAIKQDISANLDRADLSVPTLAARHGMTPRLVQRLFETEGVTFTEYVASQRLARAHRMLSDPSRGSDKISAIAWDCGFGDISHFNHAFRRRYGLSPSDVRAQAQVNVQ